MCLSTIPGTLSGPAALWVGVRRRASWKMTGVIWPINIGTEEVGVGRTWPSHGNGALGGSIGSGDRAVVSNFSSRAITFAGVVRIAPRCFVSEDGEIGREGGVIWCPLRSAEDGLKGSACFFHEYAKKRLAVFQTAKVACVPDKEADCLP